MKQNPIVVGRVITEPRIESVGTHKVTTFKLSESNNGKTMWHNIVSHGKHASVCYKYLHIGSLCCVEGTYRSSDDSIVAERVTFLN